MAGEGLHRIGTDLLHPLAKNVLMNVQIPARLRHRYAPFPHKPNRFDLELSTELTMLLGALAE